MKPTTITLITQVILDHLKDDLVAVYLFGSQLNNAVRAESDVDIAVLVHKTLSADVAFSIKSSLSFLLKKDIDLIDLKRADTVTKAQIISTGEVLYVANQSELAAFETVCFSAYGLLNEERAGIVADIISKGSIHG